MGLIIELKSTELKAKESFEMLKICFLKNLCYFYVNFTPMNPTLTLITAGLMAFSVALSRAQTGTSAADPDPELEKIHAYKESLKQREASPSQTTLSRHKGKTDAAASEREEKERHRLSGRPGTSDTDTQPSLTAEERQARIQKLEKRKEEALAAGAREEAERIERMIRELQKP